MRNQARQRPALEVSSLLKEEDVAHRFRSLSVCRKAGHKTPLLKPNREAYRPRLDNTKWRTEQVFLAPARE